MIENGKTGFLVAPSNSLELAEKILFYLEHPALASEMGLLARENIENHFDCYFQLLCGRL